MWLAHDRVISWSVVKARSWDISWMRERVYVSYYHSSLLEFVSRFGRQNRNPLSSLRTLLSLQTWEIRLERRVEPAGNESGWLWLVWSLVVTWEVVDDTKVRLVVTRETVWQHRSSTGGSRRPWPCPCPSIYPLNLGRVNSRFVWEFVYRVACWRDRRPTSLKDIFWRRIFISIIRLFL